MSPHLLVFRRELAMPYVSGGAEHQGPPGGGPIAIIGRAS
jgi:amidohydrolase ring-opening protein AtzD/TrzD